MKLLLLLPLLLIFAAAAHAGAEVPVQVIAVAPELECDGDSGIVKLTATQNGVPLKGYPLVVEGVEVTTNRKGVARARVTPAPAVNRYEYIVEWDGQSDRFFGSCPFAAGDYHLDITILDQRGHTYRKPLTLLYSPARIDGLIPARTFRERSFDLPKRGTGSVEFLNKWMICTKAPIVEAEGATVFDGCAYVHNDAAAVALVVNR